jgi:hypothetical protein
MRRVRDRLGSWVGVVVETLKLKKEVELEA